MHDNLNLTIKIFSTIYLLLMALFTYIPSEVIPTFSRHCYHCESLFHKNSKMVAETVKIVNSQLPFINKYYTFISNLYLYKIQLWTGNSIYGDITYEAPKFSFSKYHISENNILYLKPETVNVPVLSNNTTTYTYK